nr:hypothetical protein [Paracidovorax cattleyae]
MGDLTDQNNLWGFQYAASWLSRPQPYPLSPFLPLGREPLLMAQRSGRCSGSSTISCRKRRCAP